MFGACEGPVFGQVLLRQVAVARGGTLVTRLAFLDGQHEVVLVLFEQAGQPEWIPKIQAAVRISKPPLTIVVQGDLDWPGVKALEAEFSLAIH